MQKLFALTWLLPVLTIFLANILRTVRAVAKSIRLMDEAEYVVPPEKIAKAEKYARHFLLGYMWLAFAASTAGQKLFKIRPKILGSCTGYVGFLSMIFYIGLCWFSFRFLVRYLKLKQPCFLPRVNEA